MCNSNVHCGIQIHLRHSLMPVTSRHGLSAYLQLSDQEFNGGLIIVLVTYWILLFGLFSSICKKKKKNSSICQEMYLSGFSPRTHNECQFAWAHNKVIWLIRLHIMLYSVMWLFASYVCDPTTRQDKTVVGVINQLINQLLCIKCTQPKASQSVLICFGRKYRNKVFLCFILFLLKLYLHTYCTFPFKIWAGRDEGGATIFVCDNNTLLYTAACGTTLR